MNKRAKLQELLDANKERLHELRLKKARMGPIAMPIHLITEIKEIEEEIYELESQISSYDVRTTKTKEGITLQPLAGVLERLDHLSTEITELRREVIAVERFIITNRRVDEWVRQ